MSDRAQQKARSELFIRSIPGDVTSEMLNEFFADFAPVKHAVVVSDPNTGQSKGFGFVSFPSPEDAETSINQARRKRISGKILQIEYARPRDRNKESKPTPAPEQDTERRRPRLIIRNVPWSLRDPKELEKIFGKFGKVTEAFIPRGPNNRMSGFAFVTMRRKANAKLAIEGCKDLKIHDRPVAVDWAVTKEKWLAGSKEEAASEDEEEEEEEEEADESEEIDDEEIENEDDFENGEDEIEFEDGDSDAELDEEDAADEDEEKDEKPKQRGLSDNQTIFVRNVPYDATAETLKEHFEQFGAVAYALPVMDKQLNQPRGVAFVAFRSASDAQKCVDSAPNVTTSSLLIPDDVDSRYVYEGRILGVTQAVSKERADVLAERGAKERLDVLGKAPSKKDKRNLFLLNEGRVTSESKLAQVLTPADLQIRDKSFQLRKQQLNKNPSLHLSMTRLAVRNIPRSMTEKALKALGRKAVVEFAKEVADKKRQPLSKEEVMRSIQFQESLGEYGKSKHGVVKQAKIIQEIKGSGEIGRSRGYGFLEMRNHKAALMALRYLNAYLVTKADLAADPDAPKAAAESGDSKRRLVVEFAVENAQVLKRLRDRQLKAKDTGRKRKAEEEAEQLRAAAEAEEAAKHPAGNPSIGRKRRAKARK